MNGRLLEIKYILETMQKDIAWLISAVEELQNAKSTDTRPDFHESANFMPKGLEEIDRKS